MQVRQHYTPTRATSRIKKAIQLIAVLAIFAAIGAMLAT
jgi:hypothetical protein